MLVVTSNVDNEQTVDAYIECCIDGYSIGSCLHDAAYPVSVLDLYQSVSQLELYLSKNINDVCRRTRNY